MSYLRYCMAAMLVLCLAIPAFSGTVDLPTGIATYSVLEQSGPDNGATGTAKVVTPSDADWSVTWVANSAASSWIAYDPNNAHDNGLGTYSTTFTLNSSDLSTASISGTWTLDDSGELVLNGNVIATLGDGHWGFLFGFPSVPAGSSDFVLGVNTLSLIITDTDQYLEGVNLDATCRASQAQPRSLSPPPSCCWVRPWASRV